MTDKEQITCKYKFQDKEGFNGEPYCTCFSELCEDLPICDDNCQIYEDDKQLARKTQECEELISEKDFYLQKIEVLDHECEELKNTLKKLTRGVVLPAIPESDVINLTDSYRKALEEIERYTREQFCDNCEDIGSTEYNCHCEYCEYYEYFDIISKAKEENNGINDNSK